MLGSFRIVWTSALTGLDRTVEVFRMDGRSAFKGLDKCLCSELVSEDWIRLVLQDFGFSRISGFQVFRILGFRFSVGIVALTRQRCDPFFIDTMLIRPLADYCR